jgi:hypothetical protein
MINVNNLLHFQFCIHFADTRITIFSMEYKVKGLKGSARYKRLVLLTLAYLGYLLPICGFIGGGFLG